MARGKDHDPSVRAAVIAALLEGQSPHSVAEQFKLSPSTVYAWRAAAGLDGSEPVTTTRGAELGELVTRLLQSNLITLEAIAAHSRDKTWLREQPAAELATLYGVVADKTFRLLSALEPAEPQST